MRSSRVTLILVVFTLLAMILTVGVVQATPVLSDLLVWFDVSTLDLEDGALVQEWPDLSEKGYNAVALAEETTPTFSVDAANGKPAVLFSADFLQLGLGDGYASPFTAFVVVKMDGDEGAGRDNQVFDGMPGGPRFRLGAAMGSFFAVMDTWPPALQAPFSWPSEDLYQATVVYGEPGDDSVMRMSGQTVSSSTSMLARNLPGFTIGARASQDSQWLFGSIAEIILYSAALDADQISEVEAYLLDKYGIEVAVEED